MAMLVGLSERLIVVVETPDAPDDFALEQDLSFCRMTFQRLFHLWSSRQSLCSDSCPRRFWCLTTSWFVAFQNIQIMLANHPILESSVTNPCLLRQSFVVSFLLSYL